MHLTGLAAIAVALLAFQESASIDFSKIERKIAKEPRYVAKPLYCLILVDEPGKGRVWAALDKSSADQAHYDVLYLDRNGNGDLTEEGERSVGEKDQYGRLIINGGDIQVAGKHTDFKVFSSLENNRAGKVILLKAEGRERLIGGYGPNGTLADFGESPEKAPVLTACLKAPLSFLLMREPVFARDKAERIAVLAGFPGSGAASFMAVDENYLVPGKDSIFGTWIAKDSEGREFRERFKVKGHC